MSLGLAALNSGFSPPENLVHPVHTGLCFMQWFFSKHLCQVLILHQRESTRLCFGENQCAEELHALCLDHQGFKHLWEVFLGGSFLSVWEMFCQKVPSTVTVGEFQLVSTFILEVFKRKGW